MQGVDCFKCGRIGHRANDCEYSTKQDGSPLNSPDTIEKMYKDLEAKKKIRKTTAGRGYFMQNTPTLEEFVGVDTSDSSKYESAELQFNAESKTIRLDISKKDHIYNQHGRRLNMWEVLFDSCSTCDIFINAEFLINIRTCGWTLLLKTQSGECTITMIADLPGVGVVWYYPKGSANVLSQYRMITLSRWSVHYSTDRYKNTGNPTDLAYVCTTTQKKVLRFTPTSQGLHCCPKDRMDRLWYEP